MKAIDYNMDKNIYLFVKDNYKSFEFSDLILRIVFLFLYNYFIIFLVEITSPYGYDSVSFLSEDVLPYTLVFTVLAVFISIFIIIIYSKKTLGSMTFIRGLSYGYISLSLLICSLVRYDGVMVYFQDTLSIILKLLFYILCCILYTIYLYKKTIPNFSLNKNNDKNKYIWLAPCLVICFRNLLSLFDNINVPEILTLLTYLLSSLLLMVAIEFFMKTYYAKKYSL